MINGKQPKLRYKMWFYFVLFTIFVIAVVWIFQILLFDGVFQNKKMQSLTNTGTELSSLLNTDETITDEQINTWISIAIDASESGIFTYLAWFDNKSQIQIETIFSGYVNASEGRNESAIDIEKPNTSTHNSGSVKKPYNPEANAEQAILTAVSSLTASDESYLCYKYKEGNEEKNTSFYIYVSTVKNQNVDGYLVLLASQQSLIQTISVIQYQLMIVTIVVIVVSFFISMYLSKSLSKPITEMSDTAKHWADGDETVEFKGEGYEELRELAETLNYAKEGISQTGVLQRDLLANVSHDLKTPLTMIKAYAEMIRDLSGNIKVKRDAHTEVIINEADRLTMLVNDILDLSKLQNNMNTLNLERFNLSELCERVLYRFKEFVEQSGFTIEKDIEQDLFTVADEQKIEQVIYNLVGNSINYTGEDKTILVRLTKKDDVFLFEAIDSGKGISEEKINTIWNKYYRFSETHQRPVKGTGLGLSIVKTILENHKIKFGVISKKEVGSNFFIEFRADSNEQV